MYMMALNLQNKLFVVSLLLICLWASRAWSRSIQVDAISKKHETWMAQYGRVYKDKAEKEKRLQIFRENVEYIESFNQAANRSYELAINQFADLTDEEFRASRTGYKEPSGSKNRPPSSRGATTTFMYENATNVPDSIDWRWKGAVNPIKNQGTCACCWAFSAVAAVEAITKISTGNLLSLSEQELIDCDKYGHNAGCAGGLMDEAFQYIIGKGGLTTEVNYPYQLYDEGVCDTQSSFINVARISNYEDVPANSEAALRKAVANQPVSVAIAGSSSPDFRFYSGGIFTGRCGTSLDHAVVVVGYGTDAYGTKYWLVRNSWGTGWGEDGYVRMQRDIADEVGQCGIAMRASYPIA